MSFAVVILCLILLLTKPWILCYIILAATIHTHKQHEVRNTTYVHIRRQHAMLQYPSIPYMLQYPSIPCMLQYPSIPCMLQYPSIPYMLQYPSIPYMPFISVIGPAPRFHADYNQINEIYFNMP